MPSKSVFNTAAKAAINSTPLGGAFNAAKGIGKAISGIGDALGIGGGPSRNTIASREARTWGHQAMAGDLSAIQKLYDATHSKYPAKVRVASEYLAELATGHIAAYPTVQITREVQQEALNALTAVRREKGIPFSPTDVLDVTTRSAPPMSASPRANSAAPASAPKPCKYGLRGPDGRCPKKPRISRTTGFVGSASKPPCKYGPRGPDGRCPKKPSIYSRQTAAQSRVRRKAEQVGEKAVGAGIAAAVRAAGGPAAAVSFIARGGLLVGAGLAAYAITSKLRTLRHKTYAELRKDAADAYRWARQGQDGTTPMPAPRELAQLSQWFKGKMAEIDANEAAGVPVSGLANLIFDPDA